MSFDIDSFDNVTSGMSKGPKIWSYGTLTDTLAQVSSEGYFEYIKDRVYKDDLIYVSASDDVELVKVTSQNGETPTTAIFVPASGGAPSGATYITQTPDVDLESEQALSLLQSGILQSETATGIISIAVPNVDYQEGSPALTSISGLTTASDQMIYTTASDTYATTGLTAAGRALLDDATMGDQRNTLGLGTIATQNSNNVMITGGSITGISDLAIADGGTGASTNTAAINNLVNNASLTTATVATGDLVLIQDISDSNNLKSVTAQSIADLAGGSGGVDPGVANQLAYYASTGSTVSGLTTPGQCVLTSTLAGVPTWAPLGNGQLIIGDAAGDPNPSTLTAGTGISISNGNGSITISSLGAGFTWNEVSGTFQVAAVANGYIIGNASQTTISLPATAAIGATIAVQGKGAAGWILVANVGQTIKVGQASTSSAGSVTSAANFDAIQIVCIEANTTWSAQYVMSSGVTVS